MVAVILVGECTCTADVLRGCGVRSGLDGERDRERREGSAMKGPEDSERGSGEELNGIVFLDSGGGGVLAHD